MSADTAAMTVEERLARAEQEVAELKQTLQLVLAVVTTATERGEGR